MITVTSGPIIAVADKEANIYDADTVQFLIETLSDGNGSVFAIFFDAADAELVRFRAFEFATADFVISSTSTTNPLTLLIIEAEKLVKDYLDALNPTATFTIT